MPKKVSTPNDKALETIYKVRPTVFQNDEPIPKDGSGAPTKENIQAHPERYPIKTEFFPEETQAIKEWMETRNVETDYCSTVVQRIACVLPRHHQGECVPGRTI